MSLRELASFVEAGVMKLLWTGLAHLKLLFVTMVFYSDLSNVPRYSMKLHFSCQVKGLIVLCCSFCKGFFCL
jgi:hypothetical protein